MPLTGPYPRPGDLIEFFRPGYQHWGVYVGDGHVVHLTGCSQSYASSGIQSFGISGLGTSMISSGSGVGSSVSVGIGSASSISGIAVVRRDPLRKVAEGCDYRVNNMYDEERTPYSRMEIVSRALRKVGTRRTYNVLASNCEHFATEIRYGVGESHQVINGVSTGSAIATGAAGVFVLGAAIVTGSIAASIAAVAGATTFLFSYLRR